MMMICRSSSASNCSFSTPRSRLSIRLQKSSMSPMGTMSACLDILVYRFRQHVFDHPPAEFLLSPEIDLPSEHLRQFIFGADDGPTRRLHRLELHEHVNVAPVRIEIIAYDRSEERQPLDAPLPAKRGDLLVRDGDGQFAGGRHRVQFYGRMAGSRPDRPCDSLRSLRAGSAASSRD